MAQLVADAGRRIAARREAAASLPIDKFDTTEERPDDTETMKMTKRANKAEAKSGLELERAVLRTFKDGINRAKTINDLIELFNTTADDTSVAADPGWRAELLGKEKIQEMGYKARLHFKKIGVIWNEKVAAAYGKLLQASVRQKGGKKHRKKRTRKKKKSRKRRRIGNCKKKLKRLRTQYRRFRIAKGDKRFKGTDGLIKWSRPSKSKKKGKKRSRRIYHRKRKKKNRKKRGGYTVCMEDADCRRANEDDNFATPLFTGKCLEELDELGERRCERVDRRAIVARVANRGQVRHSTAHLRQRAHHPDDSDDE